MATAICPDSHDTVTGKVLSMRSLPEGNDDTARMMELVARKRDGELPQLRRLMLTEQAASKWNRAQMMQSSNKIQWQAPITVTEGFKQVSIKFLA